MKTTAENKLITLCSMLIAALFVLLPFHALLTVWAGSTFGHYELFRVWIEAVLLVVAILASAALYKDTALRAAWRRNGLVWVCLAYIGWQLVVGLWALHTGQVNHTALLDGWATDLRFIAFLLVCWAVGRRRQWLAARWRELLLLPAALVTFLGLLQALLLPADFLRHFGYGPHTIMPFETVDQKAGYVRLQASLRGPNALGAYLVLVVTALGAALCGRLRTGWRVAAGLFLAGTLAVLGLTYSRSAYIGAVVALGAAGWLLLKSARAQRWLMTGAAVAVLAVAGAFVAFRHNDQFQNTFFHTDEHSQAAHSSNQDRTSALSQGVHDVLHQPLGRGAGSAGPASAHNNHPARIAENYYLQVGQESGWLGLGLFIAINVLVVVQLWRRRTHQLAVVLLASFAGLTLITMLSHAWADDTLGMLWWGLAGVGLSLPGVKATKATRGAAPTSVKSATATKLPKGRA